MRLKIMLCKNEDKTFKLKIYDSMKQKYLLTGFPLTDENIIGRLRSNIFTLLGGHFYFHNSAYKIRYDLLSGDISNLKEEELFNYYPNILDLDMKE